MQTMSLPVRWKTLFVVLAACGALRAEVLWIEGEKPVTADVVRHPWWYDQVQRDQFSGRDFLSHFSDKKPGEAEYHVAAPDAGQYEFWVRANPVQSRLSYQVNAGPWTPIDLRREQAGSVNVAADGKPDLRFIAWSKVGHVTLKQGTNTFRFRMDSANSNHGYLDCFVLANEPFQPQGTLKPHEIAEHFRRLAKEHKGWFPFASKRDPFEATAGFDLRGLNEEFAGQGGFIGVKGSRFIHTATGEPVRFWAVNGPPGDLDDPEALRRCARFMAKYGVNLCRVHGGYYDESGHLRPQRVQRALRVVEAMKAEGIYCHFSIYFPLWLRPKPGTPWLEGYDGKQHPFAAIYFNRDFQAQYRAWWKALLLTPHPKTGKRLVDEPAVMGLEMVNEDSYFFWTFAAGNLPEPQLRIVETQFAEWLETKYGSLDAALAAWKGPRLPRDKPGERRIAFRPLWNMFQEKTARDKDTARFLVESQREFYRQTYQFLRELGFKGVITASNWATASPEVFGPLEKLTYTVGDFVDRHGYLGCNHKGDSAAWSIRDGHTYSDRSLLRFEAEPPGKPKVFAHPAFDPSYHGKPSMISETTWCRPNRYRSEAPLFYAVYGALQGSDAVVHFSFDGPTWSVKPNFFMQPWTLMTPAMLGQFPAAALIYRKGLVAEGQMLVELDLKVDDLLDLKGTPLPQDAHLDELRLKDVPHGASLKPGSVIDPLVHLAGRTNVHFTARGGPAKIANLAPYIDRARQTVTSSTGELHLDYGRGVLRINAPAAQGACGALAEAGTVNLGDVTIESTMPLGHVVAVSLDGRPLASSQRMLLQVMSEEKPSRFETEPAGQGVLRIKKIGQDPWMVRELQGTVRFKRADAGRLAVTPLDENGYPQTTAGHASEIRLRPTTMYYVIGR